MSINGFETNRLPYKSDEKRIPPIHNLRFLSLPIEEYNTIQSCIAKTGCDIHKLNFMGTEDKEYRSFYKMSYNTDEIKFPVWGHKFGKQQYVTSMNKIKVKSGCYIDKIIACKNEKNLIRGLFLETKSPINDVFGRCGETLEVGNTTNCQKNESKYA